MSRLPKALSAVIEADRERFEQDLHEAQVVPAGAVTVAVSLDGVMTPMQALAPLLAEKAKPQLCPAQNFALEAASCSSAAYAGL